MMFDSYLQEYQTSPKICKLFIHDTYGGQISRTWITEEIFCTLQQWLMISLKELLATLYEHVTQKNWLHKHLKVQYKNMEHIQ